MTESPAVIITGMHRSGTSLTASIIQNAGANIGKNLIGSDKGNPRGHFEDTDFNNFHVRILNRFSLSYLVQNSAALGELTQEEIDKAQQLVKERSNHEIWGWKDPRTCLFLDFWHNIVPEATYIFVYRHPLEVVLSLLRRGEDFDWEALTNPLAALRSWQTYNQAIVDFYKRNPSICVLAHISNVTNNIQAFIDFTANKLNLSLNFDNAENLYRPDELSLLKIPTETTELVEQLAPGVMSLYTQIQNLADLPGFNADSSHSSDPRLIGLQQLIANMANHEIFDQQRAYLFPLLLTYIAPEAVLTGKIALDKIRMEKIDYLKRRVSSNETRIQNLQQQNANKETQIQVLQQQNANKETQIQDLQLEKSDKESQLYNLESRLNTIETTKAWRLILKWYGLKNFLKRRSYIRIKLQPQQNHVNQDKKDSTIKISQGENKHLYSESVILFISHSAEFTGAPMVLLHFLKWLKKDTDIPFIVLLKDGQGMLRPEFEALAPVLVWQESPIKKIKQYLDQIRIGLIYSNTITNGEIVDTLLNWYQSPVICHVHELEWGINHYSSPTNVKLTKHHTDHFIAVSQAVKKNLTENLGISEDKVSVVYEFIPTQSHPIDPVATLKIRQQLNIPQNALIVGGAGKTEWRKGPDIFVQLAQTIHRRQNDEQIHFLWVGGENRPISFNNLQHDISRAGLEEYIHFVGRQSNPLDYFALFDVFAMVSREDPFPLVNLETASLGKPIICFDNAGGTPEFVEDDCGFVVPYLDINQMADRLIELLETSELRQRLGLRATSKVYERHIVATAAPELLDIIKQFLSQVSINNL